MAWCTAGCCGLHRTFRVYVVFEGHDYLKYPNSGRNELENFTDKMQQELMRWLAEPGGLGHSRPRISLQSRAKIIDLGLRPYIRACCPASAAAVRSVIVPADVFLTNKKGFPVRLLGKPNSFPSLDQFTNASAASAWKFGPHVTFLWLRSFESFNGR